MIEDILSARADELGVELPDDGAWNLARYVALLAHWNRKIRLVGPSSEEQIARDHVGDCMAVLKHIPGHALQVIDVGSGAGLPAAVIAIGRPNATVIALEPIHKKHSFLRAAKRELDLPRLQTHPLRLEEFLAKYPTRGDFAISRATWALAEWLQRGLEAVESGGTVLGMEAKAGELPSAATRHPYPSGSRTRAIVAISKP